MKQPQVLTYKLIQILFNLQFLTPDTMRFVPVKFDTMNCTIFQTHGSNAFQLAPASCAERFTQSLNLADTTADGNRFYLFDTTYNLEVFNHHFTFAWLI